MIDLHCHLLPGIDDGPADEREALALAARISADGVRVAAATPHLRPDHPGVVPGELTERTRVLQARLDEQGIRLQIVTAGEADPIWAIEASDEKLRSVSYGQRGTDLLVETPYEPLPTAFEELLFRVSLRGYRVLLAHPERNPTFQADPERLAAVAARDVLLQVTAASLLRPRRSGTGRLARQLVEAGTAHVLSSAAGEAARAPALPSLKTRRVGGGASTRRHDTQRRTSARHTQTAPHANRDFSPSAQGAIRSVAG